MALGAVENFQVCITSPFGSTKKISLILNASSCWAGKTRVDSCNPESHRIVANCSMSSSRCELFDPTTLLGARLHSNCAENHNYLPSSFKFY